MILVTLGTQDFSFNRLLEEIDKLIEENVIQEEVYAQIGASTYMPQHYSYQRFTTFAEFEHLLDRCRLLVTHGGTGTIIGGLRKDKKVIAVPRLRKYGEHVDDHQKEIISMFSDKRMILGARDVSELREALRQAESFQPERYVSGNRQIMTIIEDFITVQEKKSEVPNV